jgi:hypothetical protein
VGNESPTTAALNVTTGVQQLNTYTITGHTDDKALKSTGGSDYVGNNAIRIGGASGSFDQAAYYIFELPALASGEFVIGATLSFELKNVANSPSGNVDLYGLPFQTTTALSSSQYYQGSFGGDANSVAIQDNILRRATPVGLVESSEEVSFLMSTYLNAQYGEGAVGGNYVIFRMNSDVSNEGNYNYYSVATANDNIKPVLTIYTEQ